MSNTPQTYQVGMIGLGTMGRNLVLNMADKGYTVVGYDKLEDQVNILNQMNNPHVQAVSSLQVFMDALQKPRIIIMLVPAGAPVDSVIRDLTPLLNPGDILIDGGNSHFIDTDARQKQLTAQGIHFLGVGISGGEAGARTGPCLMPGGPKEAYDLVQPLLESIAARVDNIPCVAYLGTGSAGHYVKMVHNGIEYGLMQIISESYEVLKSGLNFNDDELAHLFSQWNQGELQSFLIEITAQIFLKEDVAGGKRLIDVILGVASQKGTGTWTSQEAMELHVPVPTIDMAVAMRDLSVFKHRWMLNQHKELHGPYKRFEGEREQFLQELEKAMYMGFILTYEQGFALLSIASTTYHYDLKLEDVARIWRGGCIIRSSVLEKIRQAYQQKPNLNTLLQDPALDQDLSTLQEDLRKTVCTVTRLGYPLPALMASLSYYDAYRGSWLPSNLIQAQRDFFGAHTYERIDQPGAFHTNWTTNT